MRVCLAPFDSQKITLSRAVCESVLYVDEQEEKQR